MRLPPALQIALGPSRRAIAWVVLVAIVTAAALAVLPIDPALLALAMLGVALWTGDRIHVVALRRGPRAVRSIWVSGDRMIVVRDGTNRLSAGHVRSSSYVGVRVTTIVWRPDRARWSRTVWILPDMLPADDFRRLRVLLRYGRRDETEGSPASHA